jgi:hypothetical protein
MSVESSKGWKMKRVVAECVSVMMLGLLVALLKACHLSWSDVLGAVSFTLVFGLLRREVGRYDRRM